MGGVVDDIVREFLRERRRIELEYLREIHRVFGDVHIIILLEEHRRFLVESEDSGARVWVIEPYYIPEPDEKLIISHSPFRVTILGGDLGDDSRGEFKSRRISEVIREIETEIRDLAFSAEPH